MGKADVLFRIQITSGGKSRTQEIKRPSFVIGRGEKCELRITASGVSRSHLNIEFRDGEIWLKDLGSSNGTKLNGKKLIPNQPIIYKPGDPVNLGLASDILTFEVVREAPVVSNIKADSSSDIDPELPPLPFVTEPVEKEKSSIRELPPVPLEVELPPLKMTQSELPFSRIPQKEPEVVPLDRTVVDPEFKRKALEQSQQNQAVNGQILEEAKAAALRVKIGAETEAALLIQKAKEMSLAEISKSKNQGEIILERAADQAFRIQREAEAEAVKMRHAMQEAIAKAHADFENRIAVAQKESRERADAQFLEYRAKAEKLLSDARLSATVIKAEAQKEAETALSEAYQKTTEIKSKWESEVKIFQAEERKKAQEVVAAAQVEADSILLEARSASHSMRKKVEKELQEIKTQSEQEAKSIKDSAQSEADQIILKSRNQADLSRQEIIKAKAQVETEVEAIKTEARKSSDGIILATKALAETRKQDLLAQCEEECLQLKEDAIKEAKKEAANLLKTAEGDRSGLSKALEKLSQDIIASEKKKVEISNSNKALKIKNTELKEESETLRAKLNEQLAEGQQKIESIDLKITNAQSSLLAKQIEVDAKNVEVQKVIDKAVNAENEIKEFQQEKDKLTKVIDDLKNQSGALDVELQNYKVQIEADKRRLRENIDRETLELKNIANIEVKRLRDKAQSDYTARKVEQDAELSKMRLTELDTIKGLRGEEEARFVAARKHHIIEISKGLETFLIPKVKEALNWAEVPKSFNSIFPELKEIVSRVLEGQFSEAQGGGSTVPSKTSSKKNKRNAAIVASAGLLALAFILFVPYEQGGRKPASEIFLEKLRQKEAQKPKFTPKLTNDYKSTYTQNVLYTSGYVDFKLNSDNQSKWIKELNKFFVSDLNLNEEAIVKFISTETSLIEELKSQSKLIHFENQKEAIQKMNDLEKSSVQEIIGILGNEQKYQSFRDFEKSYFMSNRVPASETSEKVPEKTP